jgi:hypothetical protein
MKFKEILLVASLFAGSSLIAGHVESEKLITEAKIEAGEMTPKSSQMLTHIKQLVFAFHRPFYPQ